MNVGDTLSLLRAVRLRLGSLGSVPRAEAADLLLESGHRAAMARDARIAAELEQGHDADLPARRVNWTDRLEPPSLDPVVFGEGPW